MKLLRLLFLTVLVVFSFTFNAFGTIVTFSWNPAFHGGELGTVPVAMFEDRSPAGQTPDGNPLVVFADYGASPKNVFTADDHVFLGTGFDIMALTEDDMVKNSDGQKYFPRLWWQVWAPGADIFSQPTWEYKETNLESNILWETLRDRVINVILGYSEQSYIDIAPFSSVPGRHWLLGVNSQYSDSIGYGDLWSVAGGYKEGIWNYRLLVEVPTESTDPWVAILQDGSLSAQVSGDNVTWETIAAAGIGVSGSATARNPIPEPATMLLLGIGLLGMLGVHRKVK